MDSPVSTEGRFDLINQPVDKVGKVSARVGTSRPRLRPVGPDQRGRAVTCPYPLESGRQFSAVGPRSITLGGEEALRTLVPRRFDRAHRRLSALLFADETVS